MRWHFAAVLLVLGVTLLVAHGHPIERDEQTSLEESFADAGNFHSSASYRRFPSPSPYKWNTRCSPAA